MIRNCRCKSTMSQCQSLSDGDWEDVFIKGKCYEVDHIMWSDDPKQNLRMSQLNGNECRVYLAKTEFGSWKQLTRAEFSAIFYSAIESRNSLIDDIIL